MKGPDDNKEVFDKLFYAVSDTTDLVLTTLNHMN